MMPTPTPTPTPILLLRLAIEPAVLPADAMRDVSFKLTFRNEGRAPASIHPGAAKLCAHASTAGTGICWDFAFDLKAAAGGQAPDGAPTAAVREIRTYYCPPGEPPLAAAVKKQTEVRLAPGKEHRTELRACWIPNALLPPASLNPAVLDPQAMDGIDAPAGGTPPGAPRPLKDVFPLPPASALLFGTDCATMKKVMRERQDFLRGSVVALFAAAGDWEARVAFHQEPWLFEAEHHVLTAPGVAIKVAYGDHKSTR
jgi:hypothetical protein